MSNKVEIVDISENLHNLYTIKINGVNYGLIFATEKQIKGTIDEMTKKGFKGEYGEHFAEMCAHYYAFCVAQNGYHQHYNSTGYAIHGNEYPEEYFYEVQKAVYDFVLPIFKKAVSEMKA
jgi:hypothetical protein